MERGAPTDPKDRAAYDANVAKNRAALGNTLLYGNAAGRKTEAPITRNRNVRGGGVIKPAAPVAKPAPAAAKPTPTPAAKPAPTAAAKPTPAGGSVPKPDGAKPPATPVAKPAGSAMDQWAKANPKLAAAAAEKARIRGTSQTDNPLMKDMRSKMSMTPSVQSPEVAKLGKGNQSLVNNPNASKAAQPLKQDLDIFDIVKGHLLDEGYAETEENALVIMANMSEEWRQSIINEISKELATKAFATRARDAFEMDDNKQHDKADKTKERIVKKHGKEAGDEAEKAAERAIYGHNKYSEAQEREEEKKKSTKKEGIELEDILALNRKMERVYEAQRARENPEDHDKEEKRKYEPVRGEKTPMPPRGDKRREDFEKWYAKHVR
jgi:hypothetical protein